MKAIWNPIFFVAIAIMLPEQLALASDVPKSWNGTYEGKEIALVSIKKLIFNTDKNGEFKVRAWLVGFPDDVSLGETIVEPYQNNSTRAQKDGGLQLNHYMANFSSGKVKAVITINPGYWDSNKHVLPNFSCEAFVKNPDGSQIFIDNTQLIRNEAGNAQDLQTHTDSSTTRLTRPPVDAHKAPRPRAGSGGQGSDGDGWVSGPVSIKVPSGSSIPNNSGDLDFGPYMNDLQRRIKRAWFPPRGQESKRPVVVVRLSKLGVLSDPKIDKSSGTATADAAALQAITNASPFRPLPEGAPETVEVRFVFDYNVFAGGRSF